MPTGPCPKYSLTTKLIFGQMLPRKQTLAAASSPASWSLGSWSSCAVSGRGFPSCLVRSGFTRLRPLGKRVTGIQQKSKEHYIQPSLLLFWPWLFRSGFTGMAGLEYGSQEYPPQNSFEFSEFFRGLHAPYCLLIELEPLLLNSPPPPFTGSVEAHTRGPPRLPTASGCPPNLPEFPVQH